MMRLYLPVQFVACLTLCACSTMPPNMPPQSELPLPVTMMTEQSQVQNETGAFPMLYTPPQTASTVPVCERFVSSLAAAEQKVAISGYQPYQLYTP